MKLKRHPLTGELVQEVWKNITGYSGYYEVSNYGRVKSVKRIIIRSNGHPQTIHEKILKHGKLWGTKSGFYYVVMLCKIGVDKMYQVHRLVAKAFLTPIKGKKEVNHIDEVKHNNFVFNLEWSNHRENNTYKKRNKTSKFTGVYYDVDSKRQKRWKASIVENNKRTYLGRFRRESQASLAYKKELSRRKLINKYAI